MYMHSVSFFNENSTVMFVWWLNHLVLVILRIYIHSVLFCNVDSTVNVCLVIITICFGNFQNQYIIICILYQFLMWIQLWCILKLHPPVLVISRIDKYVYAFCTILQCKFNCYVCLVIGLTCFRYFENELIFIYNTWKE
jgi:hypothetical protein